MNEDELDRIIAEALGEGPLTGERIVVRQSSDGSWYAIDISKTPVTMTRIEGQPEPADKPRPAPTIKGQGQWNPETEQWEQASSLTQPVPEVPKFKEDVYDEEVDPRDGSTWIIDKRTRRPMRQKYPGPEGWIPYRGLPKEPPAAATSSPAAWAQAQEAAAAGRHKRGTEFPWEQETWRKDYEEKVAENLARNRHNTARLAQEKVLAEAGTAADWRRAQLQASEGLFGSMSAMYPKMAAAAPLPGQEYHLGYEPGGAMADIARRGGFGYNPEQYRIGTKTFDPVEWWRLAQQMGGVV